MRDGLSARAPLRARSSIGSSEIGENPPGQSDRVGLFAALGMAARTYPSISGLLSSPSALNAVLALVFPWVGAVIVNGQPANRIGWLLCAEGVVNGVAALSQGRAAK